MMVEIVEGAWTPETIARALCMDVEAAFLGVLERCLLRKVGEMRVDEDLVGWMPSFMTKE